MTSKLFDVTGRAAPMTGSSGGISRALAEGLLGAFTEALAIANGQ